MGNKCSNTQGQEFDLVKAYIKEDLPQPWSNEFESPFEKELFMAINYYRKFPKQLVPLIKKCKTVWPDQFK